MVGALPSAGAVVDTGASPGPRGGGDPPDDDDDAVKDVVGVPDVAQWATGQQLQMTLTALLVRRKDFIGWKNPQI